MNDSDIFAGEKIRNISIDCISTDSDQMRKQFDDIDSLALSIKRYGLISPIVVKPTGSDQDKIYYKIVAGERRFRAMQMLDYNEIPCFVLHSVDYPSEAITVIENFQRKDISYIELSRYITRLWVSGALGDKQTIADMLSMSKSKLSKIFSLVHLCDTTLSDIEEKKLDLSLDVLYEISKFPNCHDQFTLLNNLESRETFRKTIKRLKDEYAAMRRGCSISELHEESEPVEDPSSVDESESLSDTVIVESDSKSDDSNSQSKMVVPSKKNIHTWIAVPVQGNDTWSFYQDTNAKTHLRVTASINIFKPGKKYRITIQEL